MLVRGIKNNMIKLTDLMKGHGKFEQGVVYSNPYHTAFAPQIAEAIDAKFDFAEASGVEFYASSPKNNIVLLPKSRKEIEKIEEEGARALLRIPNFGRKTLKEVKEFLALRGVSLLENGRRKWEQA
jgi:hypothetical protein